jgi:sulfhydrogenase subunit delta
MLKPRVGIFSLTGCGGDQLQILNMEDVLLQLLSNFDIVDFQEGSSRKEEGPIDIAFVEGTVSTERDLDRLREIRERTKVLIAFGNCATDGCIQAIKNEEDVELRMLEVYGVKKGFFDALLSKPLSEYIQVEYEIPGCPVEKQEILHAVTSLLSGDIPPRYSYPVCVECKLNEYPCVITERNLPCLGPVVRAGCDARCPGLGLDCIGCRGPVDDQSNFASELNMLRDRGYDEEFILKRLKVFSGKLETVEEKKE